MEKNVERGGEKREGDATQGSRVTNEDATQGSRVTNEVYKKPSETDLT